MTGIPKRIIQTAKSANLPLSGRASAASMKALNPGFEYSLFDDAAVATFMAEEPQEWRQAFERFRGIQRFDFFRYLAVYKLGGFYFDTDVFLARALEPLLAYPCVFPFEELTLMRRLREQWQMDWELGNYGFGARAGDPFLKAVIQNCVRGLNEPQWRDELSQDIPKMFRNQFEATNATGPGIVTRTFAENPSLQASVMVLFPPDVLQPAAWHQFGDYGVHLMLGTWRPKDGLIRSLLARRWEAGVRKELEQQSARLGPTRPQPWGREMPAPEAAAAP